MFHHYSVRPFVTLCRRALCGCLLLLLTVPAAMGDTQLPAAAYPQRHGDLTPREQAMAVKAWQYFVTNYQPATGLVNAVNNYPSTTMWDSALLPGRTDGRPRARYHRQGTVRSAADQVSLRSTPCRCSKTRCRTRPTTPSPRKRSIISTSPARSASHPSISAECCCG